MGGIIVAISTGQIYQMRKFQVMVSEMCVIRISTRMEHLTYPMCVPTTLSYTELTSGKLLSLKILEFKLEVFSFNAKPISCRPLPTIKGNTFNKPNQ